MSFFEEFMEHMGTVERFRLPMSDVLCDCNCLMRRVENDQPDRKHLLFYVCDNPKCEHTGKQFAAKRQSIRMEELK